MFTSDAKQTETIVERGRNGLFPRIARRYAIAAAACVLFAFVYAQFSHGVNSPFMTFMFAIPLVGGAGIALTGYVARAGEPPLLSRQTWALAIASLTVASCLRGIFDIAGTSSPLLVAYLMAALAFAIASLLALRIS